MDAATSPLCLDRLPTYGKYALDTFLKGEYWLVCKVPVSELELLAKQRLAQTVRMRFNPNVRKDGSCLSLGFLPPGTSVLTNQSE
jgi:hypothetical protein